MALELDYRDARIILLEQDNAKLRNDLLKKDIAHQQGMLCLARDHEATKLKLDEVLRDLTAARAAGRERVWLNAWCATVRGRNVMGDRGAAGWADACLEAFDERFNKEGA